MEVDGQKGKWFDSIFGAGTDRHRRYYSTRLNLKKGSVWMQDGRAFHRGTPNRLDYSRDELYMCISVPWLFCRWQHDYTEKHFPRDLWESLSPHAQKVLRLHRVKDN